MGRTILDDPLDACLESLISNGVPVADVEINVALDLEPSVRGLYPREFILYLPSDSGESGLPRPHNRRAIGHHRGIDVVVDPRLPAGRIVCEPTIPNPED